MYIKGKYNKRNNKEKNVKDSVVFYTNMPGKRFAHDITVLV